MKHIRCGIRDLDPTEWYKKSSCPTSSKTFCRGSMSFPFCYINLRLRLFRRWFRSLIYLLIFTLKIPRHTTTAILRTNPRVRSTSSLIADANRSSDSSTSNRQLFLAHLARETPRIPHTPRIYMYDATLMYNVHLSETGKPKYISVSRGYRFWR